MLKNKTRQNVLLLAFTAFILVTFIWKQNENVAKVSRQTKELVRPTGGDGLVKIDDYRDTNQGTPYEAESTIEYLNNAPDINVTHGRYNNITVNANEDNIDNSSTTHTDDDRPTFDTLSNPYIIDPNDENKLNRTYQKLYKDIGVVHKANDFTPYEMNKDCNPGEARKPPEAMIIGVQYCGTEVLRAILAAHPKITSSQGELHFFDENYMKPLIWYLQQMPCSTPDKITIETTSSYFDLTDPARIYAFNPKMKLIVCVCDPVDRTLSAFVHEQRLGHIQKGKTFEEEVIASDGGINQDANITKRSNYLYPLIRYISYFSKKQFYFIDIESLRTSPWKTLNSIEDFLGVKNLFVKTSFLFNTTKNVYCLSPEAFNVTNFKVSHLRSEDDICVETPEDLPTPLMGDELRLKLKRYYTAVCTGFCDIIGNHTCRDFAWNPRNGHIKRSIA